MTTITNDILRPATRTLRLPHGPIGVLLAAATSALLCGVFVHANGFIWLAVIGLVLTLGLAWPWVAVRTTTAELRFDADRGREGQTARATLTIHTRLPWATPGLRLEGNVELAEAAGELTGLPGRRDNAFAWTPGRFGAVSGKSLRITCGFPFELWRPGQEVSVVRPMLIWPATHKVGPVPDCGGDATGVHAGRRVGIGGEPCGVRDFRQGDRLRLIHWAQSAKHDRMMVRETLADATPRVRVGLIACRSAYSDAAAFDDAVRRAASCVEGWTRAGSVVELVVGSARLLCSPNAIPRSALDTLARLRLNELLATASGPAGVDVIINEEGASR